MDFRGQENNNDGLFGARNENSVLFSLDSLSSMERDSDSNGGNPSGDASGLINLSTLSSMSQAENGDNIHGGFGAGGVTVFNDISAKKSRNRMIMVLCICVAFVAVLVVVGIVKYQDMKDSFDRSQVEMQAKLDAEKAVADGLQQKQNELQKQLEDANSQISKKDSALNDVQARYDQEREKLAMVANMGMDTEDKKPKSGSGTSVKKPATPPAGAEAVASGKAASKPPSPAEVKKALEACNAKAMKCGKNGTLNVQMSINSSGSAKNVKVLGGSFAGSATEKCIVTVIERHSFPTFSGAAIPVKYTFKF